MSSKTNQSVQKHALRPPTIGPAQTAGRWIDDHASSLLLVIGSALMTLFAILLAHPEWYWWLGFVVGIAINVVGAVLSVRNANTISYLRQELAQTSEQLRLAKDQRQVFLINAALTEDWQSLLQHELFDQLRFHNFRSTIFAPTQDWSRIEQNRDLRQVLEAKDDYIAGIVIAIEVEQHEKELRDFVDAFQKPIVFMDRNPFGSASNYPQNAGFIGFNSTKGGELAAQAVIEYARLGAPVRAILVIADNSQSERQVSFKQQIQKHLPNCEVEIDEEGRFNRSQAFRKSLKHFRESLKSGQPYDVVFCTADSMTLGCLDAISTIANWGSFRPPRIIGYVGLDPVIRLADDSTSLVERVVLQDPRQLALGAVEHLVGLLDGKSHKMEYIDPRLYPYG